MTAEIARLLRALSPSFGRLRKKTGMHASATGEMPRNKADQTRLNGDANAYRTRRRVESWWDNPYEVRRWCQRFICTEKQLREAVAKVGDKPDAVKREVARWR